MRLALNGLHFADNFFKVTFMDENYYILPVLKISLKFVPGGLINNNPALVQIMAWHQIEQVALKISFSANFQAFRCICSMADRIFSGDATWQLEMHKTALLDCMTDNASGAIQ